MNKKHLFYNSLVFSVVVQIITGIIQVYALFIKVPTRHALIHQLLVLDFVVQVVEGIFYIWLVYNFTKISNVTPKRYIDWVITTPTMLITLILFLIYLNKSGEDGLDFFSLLKENSSVIIPVVVLNWLMLLFGYLGEIKVLPVLVSVFLGFIPFLIYYYMIYINYVRSTGYFLFWYFFFFWSLYGVAAVLPYNIKNTWYNILDLFAKNFFGLFLSYIIFSANY
jgi:hypothetical protein